MASVFSHPAAALALIPWFKPLRHSKSIFLLACALTIAPDLDVIGLRFGIPYGDLFGHRGLSHSFFFALAFCAVLVWLFFSRTKINKMVLWVYFSAAMISHGLMDGLTNGGLGVAYFSPFSNQRYFLPYRPIQVSTLNIKHFFDGQGIAVLKSELLFIWPTTIVLFLLGYILLNPKRNI